MAEEFGQANIPAVHPAGITLPPFLVLCELSLHNPGFLGQMGLPVPWQQFTTPPWQWKFKETKGFVLLCSSHRVVHTFSSMQHGCRGVGQAAQDTSHLMGRTWGSWVFPRHVPFTFHSKAAPEEAPRSCFPASSLAPDAEGKGQGSALWNYIKKPLLEIFSPTFLQTGEKKNKTAQPKKCKQWDVKYFHKSFWKLSGTVGLSLHITSALDPFSSRRTDHTWELNSTSLFSDEGFASFRADVLNFVLTVHRGQFVDAEAAMLHVHFCTPNI